MGATMTDASFFHERVRLFATSSIKEVVIAIMAGIANKGITKINNPKMRSSSVLIYKTVTNTNQMKK
jgi:hypothetical protein